MSETRWFDGITQAKNKIYSVQNVLDEMTQQSHLYGKFSPGRQERKTFHDAFSSCRRLGIMRE